jgi:hypothetical protein
MPTPETVMLKQVRVALEPGIAPPVPVNVCAFKNNDETAKSIRSINDFINNFQNNTLIKAASIVIFSLVKLSTKERKIREYLPITKLFLK